MNNRGRSGGERSGFESRGPAGPPRAYIEASAGTSPLSFLSYLHTALAFGFGEGSG